MKPGTRSTLGPKWLIMALFLALASSALASNTWYVDGVNGNDTNDCMSQQTACRTIGHAIALTQPGTAVIMVAPAIYVENLTIHRSLKIIGSDAATTIVDGNQAGSVFTISNANSHVYLSNLTIRNGSAQSGGGINNSGTLAIDKSTITGNSVAGIWGGGGINSSGNLTINNSTISNNSGNYGGGILVQSGTATINKSIITNNIVINNSLGSGYGGGILNYCPFGALCSLTINDSTIANNNSFEGGGIFNDYYASLIINNSTISNNGASGGAGGLVFWGRGIVNNSTISGNSGLYGGGMSSPFRKHITLQNTIVANSPSGGNCYMQDGSTITSKGYNLSSDNTCNFNGPGDRNNTDPMLGPLGFHGGPTQTVPLASGSPAIDAGNPNGCTNSNGNLLTTDQRGWRRPDKNHTGGCDIGAYERQQQ